MAEAAAPRDPGLQPERTRMAWWRTILAALVADLLILRSWFHQLLADQPRPWLGLAAVAALLLTLALAVIALRRKAALLATGTGTIASARLFLAATVCVVGFAAVCALAIVLR